MEHFLMGYRLVMVVVASEAAENAVRTLTICFSRFTAGRNWNTWIFCFQLAIAIQRCSNRLWHLGIGAGILIIFIKEIVQMIVPGVLE